MNSLFAGDQPAILPGDSLALVSGEVCLFLDVDGTLLELAVTPDQVQVEPSLLRLLDHVRGALDGALALVSGRSIQRLDQLFAPLILPVAGLHGHERRDAAGVMHSPLLSRAPLAEARDSLQELLTAHPGLLLEDKGLALALHYRCAPQTQSRVRSAMCRVARDLAPDFELLEGDLVLELKPARSSKATAVEAFLREPPFAGRRPVYVGDDVTDFDGFAAVRRHDGIDVAVGSRVSARWHLSGPAAVRGWLDALWRAWSAAR